MRNCLYSLRRDSIVAKFMLQVHLEYESELSDELARPYLIAWTLLDPARPFGIAT